MSKQIKHDDWVQSILTDIKDYHEAQQKKKALDWYEKSAVSNHDAYEYGVRRVDKWKD
tara:strand:- start:364 stop:537 length:174 start_codon:yes stop_codon:yes gene_type:complete